MPPLLHILPHANKWPPLYPLSYTLSGHLQHAPLQQPLPHYLQTIIDLWHNDPWLSK